MVVMVVFVQSCVAVHLQKSRTPPLWGYRVKWGGITMIGAGGVIWCCMGRGRWDRVGLDGAGWVV